MTKSFLLPGFGGTAEQPLLVRLAEQLADPHRVTLTRAKLTPGLEPYVAELAKLVGRSVPILIGRSFGGRVALRLAHQKKVKALVLLGFPVRPPGKRRELDEELLHTVSCPTLIVQGSDDELGPLKVLRPLLSKQTTLHVLEGAEHSFGRHEAAAIGATVEWLRGR